MFYKFHEYTGRSPYEIVSEAVKAGDILTLEMSPTGGFRLKNPAPDLQDNVEPMWHGWLVVEKYPCLYHWKQPPDNSLYDTYKYGVVKCRNCHFVGKHQLNWPSDAYYHWDIRGNLLWAWSKEHARQLLLFIGGVNRNPDDAEGWMYRLPKQFLTAKVRPLVVKSITQSLAEQSC